MVCRHVYTVRIYLTSAAPVKTAKIFQHGNSQAVRLPKEFRFDEDEVVIKRHAGGVLLLPKRYAVDDLLEIRRRQPLGHVRLKPREPRRALELTCERFHLSPIRPLARDIVAHDHQIRPRMPTLHQRPAREQIRHAFPLDDLTREQHHRPVVRQPKLPPARRLLFRQRSLGQRQGVVMPLLPD